MPVLPELEPLLERIRAAEGRLDSLPLAERRAMVHQGIDSQLEHMVEPVPAAPYSDHLVAVDGGQITVRLYRPQSGTTPGCHLYVHGGGWWMGTLDQSDLACSRIVNAVGCAVASVDHRLAREHPYPAPVEDCYAALVWLAATPQSSASIPSGSPSAACRRERTSSPPRRCAHATEALRPRSP